MSSSSVNCKSIQQKEHHCLKNVACRERMSLSQAFCVRYIKFVNINRVCQSVRYNTFVTVLIVVELANKESHFIRVIMELQGESKSPPNKQCQLVVLMVAGLERVTLINNNQIQNWLPHRFNLSVSVSVRWFYNNLSHVTYHVCTIDSTGHLNLPIVFSPWCKGLWAFSCCSSTAVIWVKQHLFIASCEAYWWRKCFRIPFPFTICKIM